MNKTRKLRKNTSEDSLKRLTNTQLQRVESRENLQQKAWAMRAHGVMRKPGSSNAIAKSMALSTSSSSSSSSRMMMKNISNNSNTSNVFKIIHNSNQSISNSNNSNRRTTKRVDLRTRDDYNFHDMLIFEKKQLQPNKNILSLFRKVDCDA